MKRRKSNYYIFYIFVLCLCCKNKKINNDHVLEVPNKEIYLNDIISNWKKDTLGCLHLRNPQKATMLVDSFNLIGKSEHEIIYFLGKPNNEVSRDKVQKTISYYFDSMCVDQTIIEQSDKCFIDFNFENNKLKSLQFICQ